MGKNNFFNFNDGFGNKSSSNSFTTPSTQGRTNSKTSLSPFYRNPLDISGFGTKEHLDPAYKNPLDNFHSPADGFFQKNNNKKG